MKKVNLDEIIEIIEEIDENNLPMKIPDRLLAAIKRLLKPNELVVFHECGAYTTRNGRITIKSIDFQLFINNLHMFFNELTNISGNDMVF